MDSNQYAIELVTYLLVLVVYFYELIVYMLLERHAIDSIAFFPQYADRWKSLKIYLVPEKHFIDDIRHMSPSAMYIFSEFSYDQLFTEKNGDHENMDDY